MPRLLFTLTIHSGSNKIKRKGETPSLYTLWPDVERVLNEELGPNNSPLTKINLKVVFE